MFSNKKKHAPSLPQGFTVTAHSGCEGTADNSMEFLQKCVEINAQVAEMDVTFRRDGTPVILHKELAENDEGLPLCEALKYLSENTDNMLFNLDLKAFSNLNSVAEEAKKYSLESRCFFTGVKPEQAETLKLSGIKIPYYINKSFPVLKKHSKSFMLSLADFVNKSGAIGINCNYAYASREMTEAFREKGLLTSFWTANSEKTMKKLLRLSPDNITTRFPLLLKSLIEEHTV